MYEVGSVQFEESKDTFHSAFEELLFDRVRIVVSKFTQHVESGRLNALGDVVTDKIEKRRGELQTLHFISTIRFYQQQFMFKTSRRPVFKEGHSTAC